MFGKNRIYKQDLTAKKLRVQEIFKTIQGEGPFAGVPSVFIRLARCCLTCQFCDTDFESVDEELSYDEVFNQVLLARGDSKLDLVVITGGEPLIQPLAPLIFALLAQGFKVQLETSGVVWDPELSNTFHDDFIVGNVTVVVSPKTGKLHPDVHKYASCYKYIIKHGEAYSSDDGLPLVSPQTSQPLELARPSKFSYVYLQPCDDHDQLQNLLNQDETVRRAIRHGYRVSVQTHKVLGLP